MQAASGSLLFVAPSVFPCTKAASADSSITARCDQRPSAVACRQTASIASRQWTVENCGSSATRFFGAKLSANWSFVGTPSQPETLTIRAQAADDEGDTVFYSDADEDVQDAFASAFDRVSEQQIERVRVVDDLGRAYGTGRRKEAAARVWVKDGTGQIIVNHKPWDAAFGANINRERLLEPLQLTELAGKMDIWCTVQGGGVSGQIEAVRLGVSRALQNYDPAYRPVLKKAGLLTRDPRVVERKKYGRKKARKLSQFSKR